MASNLPTTELEEKVIFSVVSGNNGKVGIKNTEPTERFVVNDPIRRSFSIGNNFTTSGTPSNVQEAFFYGEGSRLYLQGRLNLEFNETYTVNDTAPVAEIPSGYRPLKNFNVIANCFFVVGGSDVWVTCTLTIKTNGQITVKRLGSGLVSTNTYVGVTDSSPAAPGSFYVEFDNIDFIYKQPV